MTCNGCQECGEVCAHCGRTPILDHTSHDSPIDLPTTGRKEEGQL